MTKKKKLFVARDRFGEKPIYYSISDNNFFSSDAKSIQNFIKSNTSKLALAQYLFYGYIPSPKTVYDKIEKLRPGNYLIYNLIDNSHHLTEYFNIFSQEQKFDYDKNTNKKLQELIQTTTKNRSISDFDTGSFLSGGIDSSIVSYSLSKIKGDNLKTFFLWF